MSVVQTRRIRYYFWHSIRWSFACACNLLREDETKFLRAAIDQRRKHLCLHGLFKIAESRYTLIFSKQEICFLFTRYTRTRRSVVGRQFRYIGRFRMSGEQEMQVENIDRVPPEASATCNVSWCTRLCEYRCSASRTRTVYFDHSSLQFCRMKSRGRKFFELIQGLERALKIDRLVAISSGGWYSCALRWWLDSHFYRTMRFFTLRERERYWIPFSTKEEIIKKIREIPERMLKLVIAFRFHTTFYGKISSIASPAFISS